MKIALKPTLALTLFSCIVLMLCALPSFAYADSISKGPFLLDKATASHAEYFGGGVDGYLRITGDITITGMVSGVEGRPVIEDAGKHTVVIDSSGDVEIGGKTSEGISVQVESVNLLTMNDYINATLTGTAGRCIMRSNDSTLILAPESTIVTDLISQSCCPKIDLSRLSPDNAADVAALGDAGSAFIFSVPPKTTNIKGLLGGNTILQLPAPMVVYMGAKEIGTIDTSGDIAYNAASVYTVTFKDWDGETLETQFIKHSFDAVAPPDPLRQGHYFIDWDVPFTDITSNTIVTATYLPDPQGSFVGGSVYVKNSDTALVFKVGKDYSLFSDIEVDGKRVDSSQVEVTSGSTVATLKASYLDTLSVGDHAVRVFFSDGASSTGTFQVHEAAQPKPQQTDNSGKLAATDDATPLGAAALIAGVALVGICIARRKLA